MTIQCAKCKAENNLDEGADRELLCCCSCEAPLSEAWQSQFPEMIERNKREIEKLKWRTKESN